MSSKSKQIRSHAKKRAKTRFSLYLTEEKEKEIIRDILGSKYKFIEKDSNTISIYETVINDKICHIVYNKKRKQIVTLFEPGAL